MCVCVCVFVCVCVLWHVALVSLVYGIVLPSAGEPLECNAGRPGVMGFAFQDLRSMFRVVMSILFRIHILNFQRILTTKSEGELPC